MLTNAPRAIDFLCDAFGFERHAVHADATNPSKIDHAQLVRNGQMIMLSTAQMNNYTDAASMITVEQAGGNTRVPYITVDDVDAHAEHARGAGADIFMEPTDQDDGGRSYSARDPEGNVWNFGSYDPFA